MRFKPGQKVVCVRPTKEYVPQNGDNIGKKHNYGPKYNEIVTIRGYDADDDEFVLIQEYPGYPRAMSYWEIYFEPLISDDVIARELESVPEPFTISK